MSDLHKALKSWMTQEKSYQAFEDMDEQIPDAVIITWHVAAAALKLTLT